MARDEVLDSRESILEATVDFGRNVRPLSRTLIRDQIAIRVYGLVNTSKVDPAVGGSGDFAIVFVLDLAARRGHPNDHSEKPFG